MKDIREMLNISYFDNKELSLKEHCDIYSNIKKDLISILNKYDIKYVIADTESIRDLSKENQELKKQLEETQSNYEKEKYIVDKQTRQLADEYKNTEYQSNKVKELKNQQKEFIEYLENEIKQFEVIGDLVNYNACRNILSKYKEIIGGNNGI